MSEGLEVASYPQHDPLSSRTRGPGPPDDIPDFSHSRGRWRLWVTKRMGSPGNLPRLLPISWASIIVPSSDSEPGPYVIASSSRLHIHPSQRARSKGAGHQRTG